MQRFFLICVYHAFAFETLDIVYILRGVSLVNIFDIWFGLWYL